ncbi:MAG TPA: tetratricopeptide repeat protein [Planctomycetota bacterium]|nr:tetratricopeptide repeat protein [Planctomycetota bacterium]
MKISTRTIAYSILTVLAVAFGIRVFLYGGSTFQDPGDSPLYKSTLDRAVANFKDSDYVVSRDGAPKGYGGAAASSYQQPNGVQQRAQGQQADPASQYLQAGLQAYQQKNYKGALAYFEAAAQYSPANATVQTYLGMTYDKLGDKAKSQQALQKAALLRKGQPGSQQQKAGQPAPQPVQPGATNNGLVSSGQMSPMESGMMLYRHGKFDEAATYFQLAIKASPADQTAYSMLGSCYFALRDNDKMIETYKSAVQANPTAAEPYYNLGIAYSHLGKTQDARQAYGKAIQINPAHSQAHAGLGKLLQAEGKNDEALKEFQYEIDVCKNLMKQKPDEPSTYNRLAHFYLQNNINLPEGIELIARALELKPDDSIYLATAAQLQAKSGNKDKAIEFIDKALQKSPDSVYFQAVKRNILKPPAESKPEGPAEDGNSSTPAKESAESGKAAAGDQGQPADK